MFGEPWNNHDHSSSAGNWQVPKHYGQPWQVTPNVPSPYVWPQPQPETGTTPAAPHPVEIIEVHVKTCPQCEENKRVDTEWDERDYICRECRYGPDSADD